MTTTSPSDVVARPRPPGRRQPKRARGRVSFGWVPGLDGMRALAVIAVLLYHADQHWIPGGFLGVEVFFVISGYLITGLLLAEKANTGGVRLGQFWLRRARRLLPALFVLLISTSAVALLFVDDAAAKMKGGVVAALAYVTNWYLTYSHQSYFEFAGRPSLLQHLWSLAVEEQFYLFWPIILLLLVKWTGGERRKLAGTLVGMSLASTLWMYLLVPKHGGDPSRVYYGTDTRAAGLVLGAALAVVWAPWRFRKEITAQARLLVDGMAAFGLVLLAWIFVTFTEFGLGVYEGGFLLTGVATCIVIAGVAHPASRIGQRILGSKPFVWVGQRSYGIYLWHWPVFMLTRPQLDLDLRGTPLLVLRFALTLVIAELSYRYVEQPVRSGAIGRWREALRADVDPSRPRTGRAGLPTLVSALAMVGVVLIVAGLAAAKPPPPLPGFEASAVSATGTDDLGLPTSTTAAPATTVALLPGVIPTAAPTTSTTAPPPPPVTMIGDSVMLGAKAAMVKRIPGAYVNAKVGRDFFQATSILQWLKDHHQLSSKVVIDLGNNGPVTEKQFDGLMAVLADTPKVVFVNVKVPRSWEGNVNDRLAAGVAAHPNTVLVDWHTVGNQHPSFFYDDGIHLKPDGAAFYADLIASQL